MLSSFLRNSVLLAMGKKGQQFYYAVRNGRNIGVYLTWPECEAQVKGFTKPAFKKFPTEAEAWAFVNGKVTITSESGESSSHAAVGVVPPGFKRKREDESNAARVSDKTCKLEVPQHIKQEDSEGMLHVYTDGSCTSNGFSGARAGIGVWWGHGHPMNVGERLTGRQTNNRAEIHAAVRALEQVQGLGSKNVTIYTDSAFMINSITKWVSGWIKKDWKLADGQPVKNKEDFQALLKAAQGLNVKWVHVRGHRGNVGNEEADRLAVAGQALPLPDEK